ncbi:hypothetical protein H7X46_17295 [Pseudonocardia sp. C8]|uniref:hypothetical protein n=1 Tax=Pseudonocardia sp. C8 TaxID=2762759 RepID=UPI0016434C05|nr:hypothetical protein [Pseudonocardia sp. C8]MBC3192823.1 hypothetical protein [Pseudonocardia sp. C8]
MSSADDRAGAGRGPEAAGVEPSAAEPDPADEHPEQEVPIGSPVGPDEWRELKRRAEQPDPPPDRDDTAEQDPEAPSS